MKRKASISHEKLRCANCERTQSLPLSNLRAALEDDDEPSVLLIALRRIAEARGGHRQGG